MIIRTSLFEDGTVVLEDDQDNEAVVLAVQSEGGTALLSLGIGEATQLHRALNAILAAT